MSKISIKNDQEIEYMREAGKIAYDLLMSLKKILHCRSFFNGI